MIKREDVIAALGGIPERLMDLVSGLEEFQLEYRHGPAFSTIGEVTSHLIDSGAAVDKLLRQAFLEGDPKVNVRQTVDSPSPQNHQSLAAGLRDYARDRRSTVDLLRGLKAKDWKQPLQDPVIGEVQLVDFCQMEVEHEMGHLVQVRTLTTLLSGISLEGVKQ